MTITGNMNWILKIKSLSNICRMRQRQERMLAWHQLIRIISSHNMFGLFVLFSNQQLQRLTGPLLTGAAAVSGIDMTKQQPPNNAHIAQHCWRLRDTAG